MKQIVLNIKRLCTPLIWGFALMCLLTMPARADWREYRAGHIVIYTTISENAGIMYFCANCSLSWRLGELL